MSHFHFPPAWHLAERRATPESTYLDRRQMVRALGFGTLGLAGLLPGAGNAQETGSGHGSESAEVPAGMLRPALGERYAERFPAARNGRYRLGDDRRPTPEAVAARYNNFYEFTTTKDRVWELAAGYRVDPWQVAVRGLVKRERTLDLDDLLTRFDLEERLYRFRCVERWAMQVPWTGYPLRALIEYLEPLPSARYVRFVSLLDRQGLPGQRTQDWYPWPYYEGLRLDEALHELAFVVVGAYGHALPMQHGAPWRLALPWKYGYKSPKSIVGIEFTKKRPGTFWNDYQPDEYGFYSNCDPDKPHPRWSQEWEQDIGTGETRPTELYNGYPDVAPLYTGNEV